MRDSELVVLNISDEICFFGCPEEAAPATLYGQVDISHGTLRELEHGRVMLRAVGCAKVFWDEECSYFAIMASRKRLLCMEQGLPMMDTSACPPYLSTDLVEEIPSQYMHTAQFQFLLDGHLPSSFNHLNDHISYAVELVHLLDNGKEAVLATRPFNVRRCLLPLLPQISTAFQTDLTEKWVGAHEGVRYCVMNPSFLVTGDSAYSFRVLLASSESSSAYISASLKQVVTCQIAEPASQGRMFQKSHRTTIAKTNSNQRIRLTGRGEETAVLVKLPLSPKLNEALDCDLISIEHHVKLSLKCSRFSSKKLDLHFPVLVTSLFDLPPPYEPSP
ncbi:hypothetical protein DSO57_1024278 [Entomophthora muscae]|uniref:Uncharacterized protein n=1 Tax=Entomophthora muscae TaxID=34485 RepID=A0ACC2RTR8_9FUNG|nr:hypothetical protein DSO57_1024278 [Entomophthora muscae]